MPQIIIILGDKRIEDEKMNYIHHTWFPYNVWFRFPEVQTDVTYLIV